MARTKQQARKHVGGTAPKKVLVKEEPPGPAFKQPKGGPAVAAARAHKKEKARPSNLARAVRKHRRRPGVAALQEIRKYQNKGKYATQHLIPKAPFWRLAREVLGNMQDDFRWSVQGVLALQEAAEAYLTGLFEDSQMCAIHGRRVTVFVKDMQLARRLRGDISYVSNAS